MAYAKGRYKFSSALRKAESEFEEKLHKGVLKNLRFHQDIIEYVWTKRYYVDFMDNRNKKHIIIIEAKGWFENSDEAAKYKHIRNSLKDNEELVFLFMNPNTKTKWTKKRKDGTQQTVAEWATRNGFRWFTEDTIKEIL